MIMQHLLSYFLILSVSLINVAESITVDSCDQWQNYNVCNLTPITKVACENRCRPCLNGDTSEWPGSEFPKCKWMNYTYITDNGCYYIQNTGNDTNTDNDIFYLCVEVNRPSGTQIVECEKKPWCTYKDCDGNCRPCNYGLAVKDKDWCFIDGDGLCRYEEWTDKTKKTKQLNNCYKLSTPKLTCTTTDGDGGDTLIFVNATKSIHDAITYCNATYGTEIASIYKSEIVQAISLMTNVGTKLEVEAWIGLIDINYGGWFEWDDDSCCDNVDGSCIDDWWADKEPLENGTFYVNMNQDGNINNDLEGDQLLSFFCNCPFKEIDECPILISSTTIRRLLAYILN